MKSIARVVLTATLFISGWACAAGAKTPDWKALAAKTYDWYRSEEGSRVASAVLTQQADAGDWPKNLDTTEPYTGDRSKLIGTFDNGATIGEVRFLARAYRVTGKPEYRAAVVKAVDHILEAQYPTGGWPQTFPPGKGYPRYITYNDNTMANLMYLLRDAATSADFDFLNAPRREKARKAFDAGVACILKSQVSVNGEKTVWCAQHDEVTLEPRPARTYELVSLSGSESAGLLTMLMSLENPGPDVVAAVDAGSKWFDAVKLAGIRQVVVNGDKKIVADTNAPPLWARFYEIGTNRPFFSGRDGVKKYDMAEIEAERRNGYAWYGNWGAGLLDRYSRWKSRLAKEAAGR
jgi:pectate lyase